MEFRRDRLTWLAYVVLAWFAHLQAAPGLVITHLRDELDLSYSTGGLHVAAFRCREHHRRRDLRTARGVRSAARAVLVCCRAAGLARGPCPRMVQQPAAGDRRAAAARGAGPPSGRVLDRGRDALLHGCGSSGASPPGA